MEKDKVAIVAYVVAKAGLEDEVKEELLALVGPTRNEEGCLQYELHQDGESKGRFMFYEIWRNEEAINEHFQTPHVRAIVEKFDRLFEEPIKKTLWKMLDTH
ncbi:MAG: antibiotic biosynthesis monooxygenase [Nitrospirae bacterium]|nr:antibiotic biosynthesis monooxygenase [Nitrospirota bacterium]